MEDHQYGMADLRQYLGNRPLFPPPPDLLSTHRGLNPTHPYDMLIFRSDSTASVTTNAGASSSFGGFESGLNGGGDGGTGRWPRQETLSLLEIRSRLDPKFKEANHKGPLWDEVSRMMSEEHGYQRSGKKCREKFENLYKYYKKTKEGKAGRQDGKHYRFFRQLEALYGENNNPPPDQNHSTFYPNLKNHQDTSQSLSNYSDADTSSSENNSELEGNKSKRKSSSSEWKLKIRELIDNQMKKLMDKQEAWMERMMNTIEQKERERVAREEEWRKQESARVEREHKYWASERAWIEARDAALMEALNKATGKEKDVVWPECELNRLVQVRGGMEERFQGGGGVVEEEELWEEVSTKMACFGHERSGVSCRDKWDSLNNYLLKKRSKSCYYQTNQPISNHGGGGGGEYAADQGIMRLLMNNRNENENESQIPQNGNGAIAMSDGCFRYFMGDGYGRIID